jgi:hypothetical protein
MRTAPAGEAATDRPPPAVRRFVLAIFVLLLVPGLIGFEAWPLTGWRLFSLARDDRQVRWEVDAITEQGTIETVDLDRLPLGFRLAEWPLATLPDAGEERRDEMCEALLEGVGEEIPGTVALRLVRNDRRLVERDGEWVVVDDRELFQRCGAEEPTS